MRLFIAVLLNDEMKDALTEIQEDLRWLGVRGNFTKRENLHLTLAFIGEYPDPEDVLDVLDEIRFKPFEIRLDGIGSFKRLWWAGLSGGEELRALSKRLRRALADSGIPFDRKKFSPHITLVRKPESRNGKIPEEILLKRYSAGMNVGRVALMRSERGKHGMIYTELER